MHKQLLTTAFAAFLALALVICVISPMSEAREIECPPETTAFITQSVPETEPSPETTAEAEADPAPETTPETEAETKSEPIPEMREENNSAALPVIPENAQELSLYINGRAIGNGIAFEYDEVIWLPVDVFCELFESKVIHAEVGKCYIESGDRLIPCSKSDEALTVTEFGVVCAPIEPLLSAAGLRSTEIVGGEICIWGVPTFPEAADIYSYEDLYWLSRIISAEARGEPFIGQLAVGTVVINRTRSNYYPDTIYKVIFDRVG